jgi:hypothetical protein
MAHPDSGSDWVELHNMGSLPVALQGCFLSTSNAVVRIDAPTFIPASGFLALWADDQPGSDHLLLRLPASGGLITLLSPAGQELDRIAYGLQANGISTGRLPDGNGPFQQLPFSPTRGSSNYLADLGTRLQITEFMARSSRGLGWVEIQNVSAEKAGLNGVAFAVKSPGQSLVRCLFRTDAALSPGERMMLYFGPLPEGYVPKPNAHAFTTLLDLEGATLTLRDNFDRIVDRVEYGQQLLNQSVGRLDQQWLLLASPSPGLPKTATATLDSGGSLRLNEWLAAGGGTNEFIELYNPSVLPVSLEGWVLTDDPSIAGSTNNRLGPLTFIGGGGFARFHTDGATDLGPTHTSFRLDRLGETIRLLNPAGRVIDSVDFAVQQEATSQGRYPDGSSSVFSFPGSATPGAPNSLGSGDADGDGMTDSWELLHGLDPTAPADATLDPDHDGLTNLQEFLSGTDPRESSSVLRLAGSVVGSGELELSFASQPGIVYRLEYTEGFSPAVWRTLAEIPAASSSLTVTIPDPDPLAGQTARFYRVVIPR